MSDLRRSYLRDGYVIARRLIAPASLDRVLDDIKRVFEQQVVRQAAVLPSEPEFDSFSRVLVGLFKADQPAYLAAAKLAQYTVSLHRLSLCDEILTTLKALGLEFPTVSTRQVLHIMADALRIEGGYHKTPPHQDWRSVQGSLDGAIVWMPFSDVGADNYPLEVIPESHRRGLLPSEEDPFGHRIAEGALDESRFVPLEVAKGDVVFLSAFTVHRTGVKGGRNVRVSGSFRFNNAAEPTFIERNYPNPYIYRPDMRLLRDGFPSSADIERVFPAKTPSSD
jgi:hypothetical protein